MAPIGEHCSQMHTTACSTYCKMTVCTAADDVQQKYVCICPQQELLDIHYYLCFHVWVAACSSCLALGSTTRIGDCRDAYL